MFLADYGCSLLRFLPGGTAKQGVENGDLEVDESVSLPWLTSSDLVPAEKLVPQTFWKGVRQERILMLSEAMSSLLKPLNELLTVGLRFHWEAQRTESVFR